MSAGRFDLAPSAPADRAEQALPLALELVDAVRRADRNDVQCVLDRADAPALLVVLAAMVDDNRPVSDLLGWVPADNVRQMRAAGQRRGLRPCGTHAAFIRHTARGEPIDPACLAEERRYQRERTRTRRSTTDVPDLVRSTA